MLTSRINLALPYIIAGITVVILAISSIPFGIGYDEGIWLYQARLWVQDGLPPYNFSIENKTPGISYIFSISYYFFQNSIILPKIFGIVTTTLSTLVIYAIGKKLFNPTAGLLAQVVFALFSCSVFVFSEWGVQHTETYIVFFSSLAFYFLIKNTNTADSNISIKNVIIAGIMMGASIIFKQIAILSAFSFFLYIIIAGKINKNTNLKIIKLLTSYSLGILASYFVLSLPVLLSNVLLYTYFENSWLVLFDGRVTLKPGLGQRLTGLLRVASYHEMKFIMLSFIIFLMVRKNLYKGIFLGLVVWFIFDVAGAFSTGTYYRHQFKQIIPSFSIFAGFLLYQAHVKFNLKKVYVFLFIGLLMFPFSNITYFGNYYKYGPPKVSQQGIALGNWLQQNSSKDDAVFVWGGKLGTRVMALSERRSPSKYFDLELLGNQECREEFKTDVLLKKPLYILSPIPPDNEPLFPMPGWLEDMIRKDYTLVNTEFGYNMYKATNGSKIGSK